MSDSASDSGRAFSGLDRWALAALLLFTAVVLLGFGTFGRHPELLARFPSSRGFYADAFEVFARLHVGLSFAVLAVMLAPRLGTKWLPPLAVAGAATLGVELLGTATGFPFSGYRYTELLGPRVAGLVPALIPFSWFMMGFPSYVMARRIASGRLARHLLGALLLTTWDLTLDPAMSSLAPYWIWEAEGSYYGMPLVNLLGWFATGWLVMALFDAVRAGAAADRLPARLMAAYYAAVLALPFLMTAIAGYWLAAALTLAVLGAVRAGAAMAGAAGARTGAGG